MGTALFPQRLWEQLFLQIRRNRLLGVPIENQCVKGGGLLYGGLIQRFPQRLWEHQMVVFYWLFPKFVGTLEGNGWMGGWGDGWLENVFLKKTSSPKFGLGNSDFGVCQF